MNWLVSEAWAQSANGGTGGPSLLLSLVPFLLIFAVYYFLLILPQQKRQKQHHAESLNLSKRPRSSMGLLNIPSGWVRSLNGYIN